MKKLIIFLIAILLAIANKEAIGQEHPLGDVSLLIGNGYFSPSNDAGSGTWRYAEGRFLPFGNNSFRFGLYVAGIEVESKIDDFHSHSKELGVGLAINFTLRSSYNYDRYGWFNGAWKNIHSTGTLNQERYQYNNSQTDQMLFLSGGILFRSLMFESPFAQQKITFESQITLVSDQIEFWNDDTLTEAPWNKEGFKIQFENGIVPIYLSWSREFYIMPSILAAYSYERGSKTSFYSAGVSLTLAKGQYAHDILSISYEPKFWGKGSGMDVFQVSLNIINIFKKTY